ncbi:MAG: hypothetical protein FWB90_00090 [Fibromonadales bacterium]|nr:hypothetical protein [Fibromonadales bacterium]
MLKALGSIYIVIIIFFAVFDSVRNYTYLPAVFGYLKEIAVFALLFSMFFVKVSFPKIRDVSPFFYACFFCLLFTLYHTVFSYDSNSRTIIYSIKSLEFFLCLLIFCNISKISNYSIDDAVRIYLKMCVALLLVNIIGFYIPNPIVHTDIGIDKGLMAYNGRFGLGQAPITLFPLLIVFIYQLAFGLSRNGKYLFTLACVASIFLGIATTAIVIIVAVTIAFLLLSRLHSKYFVAGARFSIVGLICVIIVIIYAFNKLQEMGINPLLMYSKINAVITGDLISDPAMASRIGYKKLVVDAELPLTEILFGRSYNYYQRLYIGAERIHVDIPIENTYANIYATSGVIGFFCFTGFILLNGLRQLKLFIENKKRCEAMLFILLLIAFSLYSYTLPITDVYSMASGFALFFAWALKRQAKPRNMPGAA